MASESFGFARGRGETLVTVGRPEVVRALLGPARARYGGQEPTTYGVRRCWRDGGPDPLDAVAIYWDARASHWHYVSFGLSELEQKRCPDPRVSGWGVELSFRLAAPRDPAGAGRVDCGGVAPETLAAPRWPITLLNAMAYAIRARQKPYRDGDVCSLLRPVDPERELRWFAFATDPTMGYVATPHGQVAWLQIVALDPGRYDAMLHEPAGRPSAVLTSLRGWNPLMVAGHEPARRGWRPASGTRVEVFN